MAYRLGHAGRAVVVAAVLLASAGSEASENVGPGTRPADEQASADEPYRGTWYGWQVFLADAASIGAFYVSAKVDSVPLGIVALVGYYGGGPIVRALHHDDGAGWSLGRRLLLPAAGGLIGAALGRAMDRNADCAEGCAALGVSLIGIGAGATVAMVYDWVATQESAPAVGREDSRTWAPVIVATRQMKSFGVALRF